MSKEKEKRIKAAMELAAEMERRNKTTGAYIKRDPVTGESVLANYDSNAWANIGTSRTHPLNLSRDYGRVNPNLLDSTEREFGEMNDFRAEAQPTSHKWGNAFVKTGTTALTTFLDGTLGTAIGLGNINLGEDNDQNALQDFIFNPFSKAMTDFQERMEEIFPNYYTEEEANRTFAFDTANFWADKFMKNTGFTIGAVLSGAVFGAGMSKALGTKALQKAVARQFGKESFKKGGELALKEALEKGLSSPGLLVDDLLKIGKQLKTNNLIEQVSGAFMGSIGEARIEAIHGQEELYNDYLEQGYSEEDAKKASMDAANMIFAGNVAVLSLSNFSQFKNAFSGQFATKAANLTTKTGNVYKELGKFDIGLKYAGAVLNPLREGAEEMSQAYVKNIAKEYQLRRYDEEANSTVADFLGSTIDQFGKTFGDPKVLEEGFIGALTGTISMPYINQEGKVKTAGGIYHDLVALKGIKEKSKSQADELNKIAARIKGTPEYLEAVGNAYYEAGKTKAAEEGDMFSYKTKEFLQFVNDAQAFIEADKFEDFLESLESIKRTDAVDLRKLLQKEVEEEVGGKKEKKLKALYPNLTTDQELKTYVDAKVDRLIKDAKMVRNISNAIDMRFPTLDKKAKDTMLASAVMVKNSESRIEKLIESLRADYNYQGFLPTVGDGQYGTEEDWKRFKEEAPEHLKGLDKFISPNGIQNSGVYLLVNDLLKLKDLRESFGKNYLKLASDPIKAQYEAEENERAAKRDNDKKRVDAVPDGTIMRGEGNELFKVKKINGKNLIYRINPTTGELTEVEELTVDNMDSKYIIDKETGELTQKDQLARDYTKAINEAEDIETLLDIIYGDENDEFMLGDKKVKSVYKAGFKMPQHYIDLARKRFKALTGKDPSKDFGKERYSDDFIYINEKGEKLVATYDTKTGKVYTHSYKDFLLYGKKKMSKQQYYAASTTYKNKDDFKKFLNESGYKYLKGFLDSIEKKSVLENLENIINLRDASLTDLNEKIKTIEDKVLSILVELEKVTTKLPTATERGGAKAKLNKKLDTLTAELSSLEEQLKALTASRTKVKAELNHFLNRYETAEQKDNSVQSIIKQKSEELKEINNQISYWKSILTSLVEILNNFSKIIVSLFGKIKFDWSGQDRTIPVESYEIDHKSLNAIKRKVLDEIELNAIDDDLTDTQKRPFIANALRTFKEVIQTLTKNSGWKDSTVNQGRAFEEVSMYKSLVEKELKILNKRAEDIKAEIELLSEEYVGYEKLVDNKKEAVAPREAPVNSAKKITAIQGHKESAYVSNDVIPEPDEKATSQEEEEKFFPKIKRYLKRVFKVFAGNSLNNESQGAKNYFDFVNFNSIEPGKYVGEILEASKLLPQEEIDKIIAANPYYRTFPMLYTVVKDKDGNYIGVDGKAITYPNGDKVKEFGPIVIQQGIYTPVPTPNLEVNGKPKYYTPTDAEGWKWLYPELTEEAAKKQFEADKVTVVEEHKVFIEKAVKAIKEGKPLQVKITGKTKGVEINSGEVKSFEQALQTASDKDVEIVVPTANKDKLAELSMKLGVERLTPGYTYLKDLRTGNVYKAQPRKLSGNEIELIIDLFRYFASNVTIEKGLPVFKDAGKIKFFNGSEDIETNIFDVISNYVLWTGDNLTAEGKKDLESKLKELGEAPSQGQLNAVYLAVYSNSKNLVNKTANTSFHWMERSKHRGGEVVLGVKTSNGKIVQNIVPLLNATENGLNPELETELRKFLADRYIQVRAPKLNVQDKFYHFETIKDKKLIVKDTFPSYQAYLISEKYAPINTKTVTNGSTSEEGKTRTHENQNLVYSYEVSTGETVKSPKKESEVKSESTAKQSVKLYSKDLPFGEHRVEMSINGKKHSELIFNKKSGEEGAWIEVSGLDSESRKQKIERLLDFRSEDGFAEDLDDLGNSLSSDVGVVTFKFISNAKTESTESKETTLVNAAARVAQKLSLPFESLHDLVKKRGVIEVIIEDNATGQKVIGYPKITDDGLYGEENFFDGEYLKALQRFLGEEFIDKNGKQVTSFSKLNELIKTHTIKINSPSGEKLKALEAGALNESSGSLGLNTNDNSAEKNNEELDDADLRRVIRNSKTKTENEEKMRSWFKARFGDDVEYHIERVRKIINKGSWGTFREAAVYVLENSEVGTTYHEAWHVLTQLYLTKAERKALYDDARKSMTGKKVITQSENFLGEPELIEVLGETMTDYQAEEFLAEEFAQFMLNGKSPLLGKKSKSIFQKIIEAIKTFFGGKTSLYEEDRVLKLFEALRDNKLPSKVSQRSPAVFQRSKKSGFDTDHNIYGSSEFFGEVMSAMDALFFEKLLYDDKVPRSIFDAFKLESKVTTEVYQKIKRRIKEVTEEFATSEEQVAALEFLLSRWSEVVSKHLTHLTKWGIDEINEDTVNEGILETDRGRDSGGVVPVSALKLSSKHTATNIVKIFLSTLPQFAYVGNTNTVRKVTGTFTGLPVTASFGKSFSVLQDKLLYRTSIEEMFARLEILSGKDPNYREIYKRLSAQDAIDTGQWETADKGLLALQFEQAFRKSRTNYAYFFVDAHGRIKINDASEEGFHKTILQKFKAASEDKADRIFIKKDGKRYYKPELAMRKLGGMDRRTLNEYTDFLQRIGIDIDVSSPFISDTDRQYLKEVVGYLSSAISEGDQIDIFDEVNYTNHHANLKYLVKMKMAESLDYIESSHFNMNNDLVFDNTLFSEVTLIEEMINKNMGMEEILEYFPELENSFYLREYFQAARKYDKSGEADLPIKLVVAEGIVEGESKDRTEFKKLSEPTKLSITYSMYKRNMFPMLRPADNTVERFVQFSKTLRSDDYFEKQFRIELAERDKAWKKGYVNYNNRFNDGVLISFASFDPIKKEERKDIKAEIDAFFAGTETVESFMARNWEIIRSIMLQNTRHYADELRDLYLENGLLVEVPTKEGMMYRAVGVDFRENNTNESPDSLYEPSIVQGKLRRYVEMNMAQSIEQFKLFFGDPRGYKNIEDMFKRFAGAVGTKRTSSVSKLTDNFIEKLTGKPILKHNDKPVIRTFTFDDVMVINEELIESYHELFGVNDPTISEEKRNEILKNLKPYGQLFEVIRDKEGKKTLKLISFNRYKELKAAKKEVAVEGLVEGDGGGVVSWEEWRTMKVRSGDWSFGKESLEALYQWEVYEMNNVAEDVREYIDPVTKKSLGKINPKKLPVVNPLKPQYFGPNTEGIHTMFKMSLMPLQPSVIKGKNLEKLHQFMMDNRVGIAAHYSANKGISTKLKPDGTTNRLYDASGNFKLEEAPVFQEIYYKFFGIQLDTGNKVKKQVITGTQMMKQMLTNLYSAGKALNDRFDGYVKNYTRLNEKRIQYGKEVLMENLGMTYYNDTYFIKDTDVFLKNLTKEASRRDLPDNVKEGLELLKETFIFDGLPNRASIEGLLNGMADSYVISQKRNGGAYYQEPSTFFEASVSRENHTFENKAFKASDLKFYTNKDGKVSSIEVYLPDIYKGKVPIGKNNELLRMIGFRIPTQGLNSIESIVVKGFLPASAGELVIMPSDIVAKAGSDYDIDKLNLYMPNYYMDKEGNPTYIDPNSSAEDQYNDYLEAYKFEKHSAAIDRFLSEILGSESSKGQRKYFKALVEEYLKTVEVIDNTSLNEFILKEIDSLSSSKKSSSSTFGLGFIREDLKDEQLENRIDFLNDISDRLMLDPPDMGELSPMTQAEFFLKHTENGITEVQHKILLDPDNFRQLTTPDSSFILKGLSEKINELLGVSRDKAKTFEATIRTFQAEIDKRYLVGNQAIGIAALASTFHVMSQLSGLTVGSTFKVFKNVYSTKINMLHNYENGRIQLGKTKDAEGNYNISQILSQWISAAVDAAKDPFMFDLNATEETLPIILMLTSMGVPMETTAYFMNQPSIKQFMQLKKVHQSPLAKENKAFVKDATILSKMLDGVYMGDVIAAKNTRTLSAEELKSQVNKEFDPKNYVQRQALLDFYRYMMLSREFSKAIQGTTFDTKSVGKNFSENALRLNATQKVKDSGLFENYDVLVDSSFIGPYHEAAKAIKEMQAPLFLQTKDPVANGMFEGMVKWVSQIPGSMDDKISVLNKFRLDFLVYVIKTNTFRLKGYTEPINIANQESSLYSNVGEFVQSQIKHIKAGNNVTGKALFDALIVVKNEDMLNIRGTEKSLTPIEVNSITEAWEDLYEANPTKGMGILIYLLAQSGLQGSTTNFIRWAPAAMLHQVAKAAMLEEARISDEIKVDKYTKFLAEFFISNHEDGNIVPKEELIYKSKDEVYLHPKLSNFPFVKSVAKKEAFKNYTNTAVYQLSKDGKDVYDVVPNIKLAEGSRPTVFKTEVKPAVKAHRKNYTRNGYGNIYRYLTDAAKQRVASLIEWFPGVGSEKILPKDVIHNPKFYDNLTKTKLARFPSTYPLDLLETYFIEGVGRVKVTEKKSFNSFPQNRADGLARVSGYDNKEDLLLKSNDRVLRRAIKGTGHIYLYQVEKVDDYIEVLPAPREQKPVQLSMFNEVKTLTIKTLKIISGGQTGVDMAGLDAALEAGVQTGGTAAAYFTQSVGEKSSIRNAELATKYGLKEGKTTKRMGSRGSYDDVYYQRTIDNAQEADGTVWFGNPESPGGKLTLKASTQKGKPSPIINPTSGKQLLDWMIKNNVRTLNVAGNREHTNPGIYAESKRVISEMIELLKEPVQKGYYEKLGNKTTSNFSGVPGAGVQIVSNPNEYLDAQRAGEAVVAYKGASLPQSFENPFHVNTNATTKENVENFIQFVINGSSSQAKWIKEQILSGKFKGKPIYYGNTRAAKEGVPSHATALDWLINSPESPLSESELLKKLSEKAKDANTKCKGV